MYLEWGLIEAVAKAAGLIVGIAAATFQAYNLGVKGFQRGPS